MAVYSPPGVLAYKVAGASLEANLPLGDRTHDAVVQAWDRCGGSEKVALAITVSGNAAAAVPSSSHVFLLVEENHSYADVVRGHAMPYLNSLATRYGLATEYYADTHPSIGNYFMLTTGQVITNDDSFCGTVTQDNLVRHLLHAGKTWKAYPQSLPAAGYTGCGVYPYAKKHNPFAFFSDVADSSEKYNLVPFPKFASDLANHTLPDFSFIVPDLLHDAHDGSLSAADAWLKTNIAPLSTARPFRKTAFSSSFSMKASIAIRLTAAATLPQL